MPNNSINDPTDNQLVVRIKKGDRNALGILFRRYQKPFYNLAYRITGDAYLADDITSTTFLKIYQYLDSFDLSKDFKPWAYRVAVNVAKSYLGLTGSNHTQPLVVKLSRFDYSDEDNVKGEAGLADPQANVVNEYERQETADQVQKALLLLPVKYRLPIYLYYFEELKYDQIAGLLDLPLNTVRIRLRRGKQNLKAALKGLI